MIDFFQFVTCAIRAYRNARRSGRCAYVGLELHGVPNACVLVGIGREAWRVSEVAINACNWVSK
jgi:hypothetical protein